jgi:hypothetical protein
MSILTMAIKVTRRTVAVAVFRDRTLSYAEVRHLSSHKEAADASATAFVNWTLHRFDITMAAIEDAVASEEARSAELVHLIENDLLVQGSTSHRVSKNTLFEAFAIQPLSCRKELHEIVRQFWPQLNSSDFHSSVLDAAALGLYAQVEYLLSK